jgi:23S rRNA (cytidine1920-2'-O)/16S rRNA (cytidine1409-2'-O)-methyltransferase
MLQAGAVRVYAIDVGYGQLDWRLRRDERVVVMERTNARYLTALPESVSFAAIDVSFISLKRILPAVAGWLTPASDVVALIKPQFEAGRQQVGRGGIVRQPAVQRGVVEAVLTWARDLPLHTWGVVRSPITGADGNVEFLAWLRPHPTPSFDLNAAIDAAMQPQA